MTQELDRRTFLTGAGHVGSLLAVGGTLECLLAACGGNVVISRGETKGLKVPGVFQWGATSNDGAPYVFQDPKDPTKLVGFEVDIANAIAQFMGVTEKQIETDYTQLDRALQSYRYDVIINGWEVTDDRKKTELFSQPYYRYGQQIVVRANDKRFVSRTAQDTLSLTDLEGLTVGTGASFKAADILATDTKIKLKTYDPDLPLNDLALGRLDAVLLDLPIVTYYVLGAGPGSQANTALRPIGKPFEVSEYVIAFNKRNPPTLLQEIDQAITHIKNDGTLHSILHRWSLWNDQQAEIGTK